MFRISALRNRLFGNSLLAIPAFRNLWLGQSISQIGDALYYVSFMFMVGKITGRIDMVGYIGAVELLPFLLLSPYTGVLADRVDRRLILLWSDLLSGVILSVLALVGLVSGQAPVWALFVAVFSLSSARAFFMPTNQATIPALVPSEKLGSALAFSMATMNFMRIAGLTFSATVMAGIFAWSPKWFFVLICALNALSFFGSAFFERKLPPVLPDRDHAEEHHMMKEFMEGLRYVVRDPVLLTFRIVGPLFGLMVAPFFVVYVASNKAWFHSQPQVLAWFELSFFLGMIFGSALVGKLNPRRPGLCFCISLAVVGLMVALMGFSPYVWLFAFWNVICGIAVPFADIPSQTYTNLIVPDTYRGRVNSLAMMSWTAVMPIGMMLGGVLVEKAGLVNAFLIMGGGMLAVTLAGLLVRPFREAEMPLPKPVEAEPGAGEEGLSLGEAEPVPA